MTDHRHSPNSLAQTGKSPSEACDDLPEWVEVGATFTYRFTPDNRHHGRKFHVRGIVDGQAVIAEWWKHKQYWHYTVEPPAYFAAFGDAIVPKPVRQREQRRKQAA